MSEGNHQDVGKGMPFSEGCFEERTLTPEEPTDRGPKESRSPSIHVAASREQMAAPGAHRIVMKFTPGKREPYRVNWE